MAIEKKAPKWMSSVVDAAAEGITLNDFKGIVGWRWATPNSGNKNYQIHIFLTPIERYGGKRDGELFIPDFIFCISEFLNIFDSSPHVHWIAAQQNTGKFDGPHLQFTGKYQKRDVVVNIYNNFPADEEPTILLNELTGDLTEKDVV